jgi:outer membrane protein assembly factor BamB
VKTTLALSTLSLLALALTEARADDWPQFRGPRRDGVSLEKNLLREWPASGPALRWSYKSTGVGYSGPAVVGNRLFISGARGDSEYVFAIDLGTETSPKEIWSTRIGKFFSWKGNNWNAGPSATPTVDGDLVYALGGMGDLVCVEAAGGKERWRMNLPSVLGGEVNPIGGGLEEPSPLGWGYTWSPLVDGEKLICVPGGKRGLLAALDKRTGKLLWQSKEMTDQASYSSPVVAEIGGVRQYVQVTNGGIVGIAAHDGRLLWSYRREPAYGDVVIATPIVHDGRVLSTVGFGQGSDLIKVTSRDSTFEVVKEFSNKAVESRDGGVVFIDGHVYGYSENKGWICLDFKTGNMVWTERRKLGRGSVTAVDGMLYCCAEQGGDIALVEASVSGWNEKGRLHLPEESKLRQPSGGLWTHPVVANGRLYVRDQELLFCYDLRTRK